jgi:intracellular septation protein
MQGHSPSRRPQAMQLLFDFLPLIVFFAAYWAGGIYAATAAIMVAMAAQIAYQWIRHRKVNKMLLTSGLVLLVFGGITLGLRNAAFIQWKVTVVNWLFAAALLGSRLLSEKTLIERALGEAVVLDRAVWARLNWIWIATFLALGAANLFVMYNFDEATWVNFKVFGTIGVMVAVLIGQGLWIAMRFPHAFADGDSAKAEPDKGSDAGR